MLEKLASFDSLSKKLFLPPRATPGGLQPRQGCSSRAVQVETGRLASGSVCITHDERFIIEQIVHIFTATNQSASLRPLMELPPSTLQTLDVHQAHASRRQEGERERGKIR